MGVRALYKENQVKAEEPLQASAAPFQFDLLRSKFIRNPDAEVVAIRLEPESVVSLLPPVTKFLSEICGR